MGIPVGADHSWRSEEIWQNGKIWTGLLFLNTFCAGCVHRSHQLSLRERLQTGRGRDLTTSKPQYKSRVTNEEPLETFKKCVYCSLYTAQRLTTIVGGVSGSVEPFVFLSHSPVHHPSLWCQRVGKGIRSTDRNLKGEESALMTPLGAELLFQIPISQCSWTFLKCS